MSGRRGSACALLVEVSTIALILASGAAPSFGEAVQIEQVTVQGSKPKPAPRRQSSTPAPGETFGTDANAYKIDGNIYPFIIPSVTLADAVIHYDWRQVRFAVNVKNIFDREYVASCFNFGCVYGERRRIIGSVRYRW